MAKTTGRPASPDPDRRWRLPPVPTHVSHSFTGAVLLEEFSGPLGLVLWQAFRDVQLWSLTSVRERGRLFSPGAVRTRTAPLEVADPDAELRAPFRTLIAMVEDASGTRPQDVGQACRIVARWAEARGAMASALAFAEAAAGASIEDARLAYEAGRLARLRAEYARAETWFLRAAGLGRRSGDWESYTIAWIGMGKLQLLRGRLPRARRALLRALRVARRGRLREVEGMALHNLVVVDTELGELSAAEAWARDAVRVYGPGHRELPRIAHDLAHVWTLQGFFSRAQAVFRALLPHFTLPADRLFVLTNVVRAAGCTGDREAFQESWNAAWKLVGSANVPAGVSRAVLDLARGAAGIGERELAVQAASRAAAFATDRDEAKAHAEAEELLESLRSDAAVSAAVPETLPASGEGDALAAEIIAGLQACVRA